MKTSLMNITVQQHYTFGCAALDLYVGSCIETHSLQPRGYVVLQLILQV